jgi:hypothetical protein
MLAGFPKAFTGCLSVELNFILILNVQASVKGGNEAALFSYLSGYLLVQSAV